MTQHKFHNIPTEVNGVKFQSRKEAVYYSQLCLAKKSGELIFFLRQVPFHLDGGVRYVCDFAEFWRSGEVRFVDTKGFRTPMFKVKKKMVEARYPVTIIEG